MIPSASRYGDPVGFKARLWEILAHCSMVFLQGIHPEQQRIECSNSDANTNK